MNGNPPRPRNIAELFERFDVRIDGYSPSFERDDQHLGFCYTNDKEEQISAVFDLGAPLQFDGYNIYARDTESNPVTFQAYACILWEVRH